MRYVPQLKNKSSLGIDANGPGICDVAADLFGQPGLKLNNDLKVEVKYKSSFIFGQPGLRLIVVQQLKLLPQAAILQIPM